MAQKPATNSEKQQDSNSQLIPTKAKSELVIGSQLDVNTATPQGVAQEDTLLIA